MITNEKNEEEKSYVKAWEEIHREGTKRRKKQVGKEQGEEGEKGKIMKKAEKSDGQRHK